MPPIALLLLLNAPPAVQYSYTVYTQDTMRIVGHQYILQ
jgi:hypothetical protein